MNPYQQYIAKSKYARFLPEENRREHWEETVERYFSFMRENLGDKLDSSIHDLLKKAVLDQEIMPSMRLMMTAGPAARRSNVAGYNCSFVAIDDQKVFDEILYILMCGTGVGFSVEQRYTEKLPEVPETLFKSRTTVVVSDSKEGWAKGLRQVLALLYSGEIPEWDLSRIRPKGSRLKVFGGRASGPEPLNALFEYAVGLFARAAGRKLTPLECHSLVCKIADIVVVGGVRRSALISLSDLDDEAVATCKSGQWWMANGHLALANNSACYREKPSREAFDKEWKILRESGSGERGIFNHTALQEHLSLRNPRRLYNSNMGTNPCAEIILNNYQFCNLTTVIVKPTDTRETLLEKVCMAAILGTYQATLTHFPYLRKQWKKQTEQEALLGVSMTGIFDNPLTYTQGPELGALLRSLREQAVITNKLYSKIFGVSAAAAVTCVKPEGTVSQLCATSSGLHGQHSRFYLRTVRSDNKDPITQFLKDQGVYSEPCVRKPNDTTVFCFPKKATEHSLLREDLTAIEHLELWKTYQTNFCEHKPSVTISVKEHEWDEVGDWVYENWNFMTGVSFLPYDGGTYQQAPYQEIDEATYMEWLAKTPADLDWDQLIETEDNVEGAQQLACSSGQCEI